MREGTPAERIRDHVPDDVATARLDQLIDLVRTRVRQLNAARVGEVHEVLVERPAKRGDMMLARTERNNMVLVDLPPSSVGEYHRVRLSGTTGSTFTGALHRTELAVL